MCTREDVGPTSQKVFEIIFEDDDMIFEVLEKMSCDDLKMLTQLPKKVFKVS
jgi:hypothetical protein